MCAVDIIIMGLLIRAGVKCWEIGAAINWLRTRGDVYRAVVLACDRTDATVLDALALKSGGDFLPFGFKDLRLRRFADSPSRSRCGRLARRFSGCFQRFLFPLPHLNWIAGVTCLSSVTLGISTNGDVFAVGPTTSAWLMVALSVLLLTCVLLAIEAIFSLTILGGYAVPFQKLDPHRSAGRSARLLELKTFVRVCANVVVASTTAVFVSASLLGSFAGLPRMTRVTVLSFTDHLVGSVYFVITTFATVGYGDIHPKRIEGQILTIGITLATFVVVALLLAVVTIAISAGDTDGRV